MKTLGIIGFGNFGQFVISHLRSYFDIIVTDKENLSSMAKEQGITWGQLDEVIKSDVVVIAIPVQHLKELLIAIAPKLKKGTLVLDVSSVKKIPMALMEEHLPQYVDVVGTHPLFGPQSGKDGIEGLNIVVCPIRLNHNEDPTRFFSQTLKLNVLHRTPTVHDQQMAYVQALTHFIGRAINGMDIPDVEQKTQAYQYLLDVKRNLKQDSMDLFLTIQNENPYANAVRLEFMKQLQSINEKL